MKTVILWALIYFPQTGDLKVIETYPTERKCNIAKLLHTQKRGVICTPTSTKTFSEIYKDDIQKKGAN